MPIVEPVSSLSTRTSSSCRFSKMSAALRNRLRRIAGGELRHSANARSAASIARVASTRVPLATFANTSPLYGLWSSNVPPFAASTHSPPISIL